MKGDHRKKLYYIYMKNGQKKMFKTDKYVKKKIKEVKIIR